MQPGVMAFTAVYFETRHGCVGFIEELPLVFDAERQSSRELVAGRELLREPFVIPLAAR